MKSDEISQRWSHLWAVSSIQQRELLLRATEEEIAAALALIEMTYGDGERPYPNEFERTLRGILPKRARGTIRCPKCGTMTPAPDWSFHVC